MRRDVRKIHQDGYEKYKRGQLDWWNGIWNLQVVQGKQRSKYTSTFLTNGTLGRNRGGEFSYPGMSWLHKLSYRIKQIEQLGGWDQTRNVQATHGRGKHITDKHTMPRIKGEFRQPYELADSNDWRQSRETDILNSIQTIFNQCEASTIRISWYWFIIVLFNGIQ